MADRYGSKIILGRTRYITA